MKFFYDLLLLSLENAYLEFKNFRERKIKLIQHSIVRKLFDESS